MQVRVHPGVDGHFESPSGKKKPSNMDRKELASSSSRNNGSQAHEINKPGLEEVNGIKRVQKERKSKPWAVYDVEK